MKKIILLTLILGVSNNLNSQSIRYNDYCIYTPNKNFVRILESPDGSGLLQATFFSGGNAIFLFSDGRGDILGKFGQKGQAFAKSHVYVDFAAPSDTLRPLQIGSVSFSIYDEPKTQITNGKVETVYPICRR